MDVDVENYQQLAEMKVNTILRAWSKIIPMKRYNNINDFIQPHVGSVGWFDWSLAQRIFLAAGNMPKDVFLVEHLDWHLAWTAMEAEIRDSGDRSTFVYISLKPANKAHGLCFLEHTSWNSAQTITSRMFDSTFKTSFADPPWLPAQNGFFRIPFRYQKSVEFHCHPYASVGTFLYKRRKSL
jgi:hypothetical protein